MELKVNYRAQLRLSITDNDTSGVTLLKMISNWVNQRNPSEKSHSAIYKGIRSGILNYNADGIDVQIRSLWGHRSEQVPDVFALRFTHIESGGPMAGWRFWVTDIGAEFQEPSGILFSITNSYFIRSGFIGKIDEPVINSPNIIKQIVSSKHWKSFVGKTVLSLNPIEVTHDNVKKFASSIFDKDRAIPIIFISRGDDAELSIDPVELSKIVVGNANVFYESDQSIGEYLHKKPHFENYRCTRGAVRVYLPGADHKIPGDYRRHRFYTLNQIREEGRDEVSRVMAESLVRRSIFNRHSGIQNVDDVEKRLIQRRLQEAIRDKKDDEIIKSYQLQVEGLQKEISQKELELTQYCNLYDEKEAIVDQLKKEIKDLEAKVYEVSSINTTLKQQLAGSMNFTIQPLETIPSTLEELLVLLQKCYPDQVVILDEAFESARGYDVRDLNKSWKLLRSIPETLYQLMFFVQGGDKRAQYSDKAGFDLSMTESKMTKNDRKLADIRTRVYRDREVDVSAHVGFGNKAPNMLRVHFWIDNAEKKVVIGHCGNHLETFSTRSIA